MHDTGSTSPLKPPSKPQNNACPQVKRRKNIPPIPFGAHSELPVMVPEGERWTQCIANRMFKTRVIDLVLLRLPEMLLQGRPARRLVVDYQQPVEYRFNATKGLIEREPLHGLEPMGEADLKFARHADRHGKLLVDSIDGDSIPIALMHHEMRLRQDTPPPIMSIYRMELKVKSEQDEEEGSGHKRPRQAESTPTNAKQARAPRTYEYVSIHALYTGLRDVIAQSCGRIRMPTHAGHEMAMLTALIALTGTDFSRQLPQLSGRTVYSRLPALWPALAAAYDPMAGRLREGPGAQLVALMYRTKYRRHAQATLLSDLLQELQLAALSTRVKENLPSEARVACTIRNANWVLAYWTCEPAPDPIQPAYGFRMLANGSPAYDDAAPAQETGPA